jgi:hypothetical protein
MMVGPISYYHRRRLNGAAATVLLKAQGPRCNFGELQLKPFDFIVLESSDPLSCRHGDSSGDYIGL